MGRRLFRGLGVLMVLALALACASVDTQWEQAKSANTTAAYEEFIKNNPTGPQADEARIRLEALAFQQAKAQDSVAGYEEYLSRYPQGRNAAAAQEFLQRLKTKVAAESQKGESAQEKENEAWESVSQGKVGNRLVIKSIKPAGSDRYGRGSAKATVKQMKDGRVAVIGGYWEQDGELVLPSGKTTRMRDSGYVKVGAQGLNLYMGAGRILEPDERLEDFLPMQAGSIHRFIGEAKLGLCVFEGQAEDPLTFALVKNIGYVYLHGKGFVTLETGKKINPEKAFIDGERKKKPSKKKR